MTTISIYKKNGNIVKLSCNGHTDYAIEGSDIVCSAISSISQACEIGLSKVLGISINIQKSSGKLEIELPNNLSLDKLKESQILLQTFYLSMLDLQSGYSKYIKIKEIK